MWGTDQPCHGCAKAALASRLARAFLNLLALKLVAMPQQDSGCMMELSFSGGPSMRLTTKQIDIVVGDLDSGRPAIYSPGMIFDDDLPNHE